MLYYDVTSDILCFRSNNGSINPLFSGSRKKNINNIDINNCNIHYLNNTKDILENIKGEKGDLGNKGDLGDKGDKGERGEKGNREKKTKLQIQF